MAKVTSPGLGNTMEKKLRSVGIDSAEALKEAGSLQAAFRLKAKYPNTCTVILYHLEAAICGVTIREPGEERKAILKDAFQKS